MIVSRLFMPLGLGVLLGILNAETAGQAVNGAGRGHRHVDHLIPHDIATGLADGYQIVVADLNGDGGPDLLPVASGLSELAWFEHPRWTRHVITGDLVRPENVDVYDVDGDGTFEIGLVSGFAQLPSRSSGIVTLLTSSGDVTRPWSAREIDRLPTSHRLRWVDIEGDGRKVLVNAPLAGTQAEPPEFRAPTPLVFYRPGDWQRQLIATTEGVIHGFHVTDWFDNGRESIVTAGFAGVFVDGYADDGWQRVRILDGDPSAWPDGGASEFTELRLGGVRLLATVEPWHGRQLVIYRPYEGGWARTVIDAALGLGHAIVPVDLDADGSAELVVADRGDGRQGVYIYTALDASGTSWDKEVLDGAMQASSCAGADLNGDGRVDVVCIGRATEDLRWYENSSF
jgi:hypothetical protein